MVDILDFLVKERNFNLSKVNIDAKHNIKLR